MGCARPSAANWTGMFRAEPGNFTNQRRAALVTGAGGALGGSTAVRLAADGHDVAVLDRDTASLEGTA
ncbi:hypothetical protein [Streptomyces sp. NBC_00334]|uniref:hypothetical protein n=1 Tax=Streptomyces sp. NBC_00334 TaxID=2975713 RepID=UPI002E2AB0C4|nr:hypothetical protein [Streptomyces sp. NBC_00334]